MSIIRNEYKRLGKNTLFVLIGNVGPKLISFLLMPFFTFWLTEEDFGIQDIIIVYSVLLVPYITLGLYESVFVFPKNQPPNTQSSYFSATLFWVIISLLIFGVIIYILPIDIKKILLPDNLIDYIPILYLIVAVSSLQRVLQSFTRGIDKMKIYSMTGIVYSVIMLVFSFIFVPKYKLNGYWISYLTAESSSALFIFIFIKGWSYITFSAQLFSSLKKLLLFSIPLIPNATMWWIINSINKPILISNVGLDGVGLYAVAGKFPSVLGIIFTIFFSAFQISAIEESNRENFRNFYTNIFKLIFLIQFVVTIGFEFFGKFIFKWFIDETFSSAELYLPILCLGIVFSNIAIYVGVMFTVKKKTIQFLYSSLIGAIVAIVANIILIPHFGIMGACISIVFSQLSMIIYRYYKSMIFVSFINLKVIVMQLGLLVLNVLLFYLSPNDVIKYLSITLCLILMLLLDKDIIFQSLKKVLSNLYRTKRI